MAKQSEAETNTEQTVSADENEGKGRVKSFLQSVKGRVILCACAAAVVLLAVVVVLLARGAGGDDLPENWPTGELMEGIRPPEQGRIASVYETESAVTVYFEEFPENALAAYLQTLGASPAGTSAYVAQKGEDRILALVYDPATKRLSLTVTPNR